MKSNLSLRLISRVSIALGASALTLPAHAEKFALLVGIENYSRVGASNLPGCLRDVADVQKMLTEQLGFAESNITALKDAKATQNAVLSNLESLAAKAGPSDTVVFYYSGHGTQVLDLDGDEADGKDEALVTTDFSPRNPKSWLLDDHLRHVLGKMKTKNVLVLMDSCHSGTGTRDGEVTFKHAEFGFKNMIAPGSVDKADLDDKAPSNHVLISGCAATEVSGMGQYQGVKRSLFTTALLAVLPRVLTATLADVGASIHAEMTRIDSSTASAQHPQVESSLNVSLDIVLGNQPGATGASSSSNQASSTGASAPTTNTSSRPSAEIPSAFPVRLWANSEVFHEGQTMEAYVDSAQAGYLRLYYVNKQGEARLIFPNGYQKDNKIDGRQKIVVGGSDSQFVFRMKGPHGMEMLLAAVSPTQFTDAAALNFSPDKPFVDFGKVSSVRALLDKGIKEIEIEPGQAPRPAQVGRAAFIYSIDQ